MGKDNEPGAPHLQVPHWLHLSFCDCLCLKTFRILLSRNKVWVSQHEYIGAGTFLILVGEGGGKVQNIGGGGGGQTFR